MLSAIIGVSAALLVVLLRDLVLKHFFDQRARLLTALDIFNVYAVPLARASTKLLWRLNEIFDKGRSQFLTVDNHDSKFEEYKFRSTIYRMASLLGWIHSFKNEQSINKLKKNKTLMQLEKSLEKLESSLADGYKTERLYLDNLARNMNFVVPRERNDWSKLGYGITMIIKRMIDKHKVDFVDKLDIEEKKDLIHQIVKYLNSNLINQSITIDDNKYNDYISDLSIREAYIFRDWQDAIGELMTTKSESNIRAYDVVGYMKFNDDLFEDSDWINKIIVLFKEIDFSKSTNNDERVHQLREIYISVASIVSCINTIDRKRSLISKETNMLATSILRTCNNNS